MDETREFHLGDILSVTTGCLVSPRHIEGVYDILNWMTGESLYTHQLPRVALEAKPVLLKMHPQLADVERNDITTENWKSWLESQVDRFGEVMPVPKMTDDEHERIDMMSEAAQFFPADKIIAVNVGPTLKD